MKTSSVLRIGAPPAQHERAGGGWLPWAFVLSLSVNVFVLAYAFFQWQDGILWLEVEAREPELAPALEKCPLPKTLQEELTRLERVGDEELIEALTGEGMVANGYSSAELALSFLYARGYVVEAPLRALGCWPHNLPVAPFTSSSGAPSSVKLFHSVGRPELQKLQAYLREAPVQLSAEGLLKKGAAFFSQQPLAKVALLRTDEWALFRQFFLEGKEGLALLLRSEDDALLLAHEIGPDGFMLLIRWYKARGPDARAAGELGPQLLELHTKTQSQKLGLILAETFPDMLVAQADDAMLLKLLALLPEKSEAGSRLALKILQGQRKPPVWGAAQGFLAKAVNAPALRLLSREQALAWLKRPNQGDKPEKSQNPACPRPVQTEKIPPTPSRGQLLASRAAHRQLKPYRTYVVKRGDTLWTIARKFNVEVEKIKYLNGLRGAALTPGRELKIPH